MWKRNCPLCFVRIPWAATLVHSNNLTCPACHTPLKLSRFTRIFGAFGGMAGGFLALYWGHGILHGWFWAMPIVVAILAYGIFSAVFVLIAGDLVVRPKPVTSRFPHPRK